MPRTSNYIGAHTGKNIFSETKETKNKINLFAGMYGRECRLYNQFPLLITL